jgi:hypothetical protein
MITMNEIMHPPIPGQVARNLKKKTLPFVAKMGVGLSPIQILGREDEPSRSINFSGFGDGETPATAAQADTTAPVVVAAKPAMPSWVKWAGIAAAAGLAIWLLKKK